MPKQTALTALTLLATAAAPASAAASGADIAEAAVSYLTSPRPLIRRDCSGFVMTVMRDAGVPRAGATRHFWQRAVDEGRVRTQSAPAPGDLAFFDDTWDANGNDRVDDPLSHIAIVVAVEQNGTVVMVHRGGSGIGTLVAHPGDPATREEDGDVRNSWLRQPGYGPAGGRRLAGQLLRGFARPPAASEPVLVAGGPDVESSAVESSAVESSAVESSAVESSAVESSAVESSAVESSAVESSAVESSAVESNDAESKAVERSADSNVVARANDEHQSTRPSSSSRRGRKNLRGATSASSPGRDGLRTKDARSGARRTPRGRGSADPNQSAPQAAAARRRG